MPWRAFGQQRPMGVYGSYWLVLHLYSSTNKENEFDAPELRPTLKPSNLYRLLNFYPLKGHHNGTYPIELHTGRSK